MTPVRTLGDLLAIVPYLLGFHPTDSAVVLGLRDQKIIFQVRGDLPPAGVDEFAACYADVVAHQDTTGALVLGYGDGPAVTPVALALRAALEARGLTVLDVLRVAGGRYWSYLCTEPACCPPDGQPYDGRAHPLAVAAIVEGCVALPSRQALERRFAPVAGRAREAMIEATRRAVDRILTLVETEPEAALLAEGILAVDAVVARQRAALRLTDDEVAWLTMVLVHLPVRDHAWQSIRGDLSVHIGLWTDVLRRAEPDLIAAPATLLAFAAWRAGEGAVASIAVSRALAADPDYRMAHLVNQALVDGLPPSDWVAATAAGVTPVGAVMGLAAR
jgi:hypothetical protein